MEIWKPVLGLEQFYAVSNNGQAKALQKRDGNGNIRKERMLILSTTKDGYKVMHFFVNGKAKHINFHRVVYEAFNETKIPKGMEVNHKNGIRDDNSPENLELLSHADNVKYSKDVLKANYVTYGNTVMTKDKREKALELRKQGLSYQKIGNLFGVSKTCIRHLVTGVTWANPPLIERESCRQ